MSGTEAGGEETTTELVSLPRITLPVGEAVTEAERRRRHALYVQTAKLREEIGHIDIPTYELVREGRDEE